jgi:hypothetical protein
MSGSVRKLISDIACKVNNPYLVVFLIRSPTFEWYVVWCGIKNEYQKFICLNEVGLRAQNMITILDARTNVMEGTYMPIMSRIIITLIMMRNIQLRSKNYKESDCGFDLDMLTMCT